MSVTRYELTTKYRGNESWDELEENPEGAYVRHGDYAALEQRLIESERYGRQTDITIDNLEMKLAQMAAENAGLKDLARGWANATDDRLFEEHGEIFHDSIDACEEELKTICPATDAFLAEVRASGVEMFAASLKVVGGHEHPYSSIANEFAAQLRKGVQS